MTVFTIQQTESEHLFFRFNQWVKIQYQHAMRVSIVVIIRNCHSQDPGAIPRRGAHYFLQFYSSSFHLRPILAIMLQKYLIAQVREF